MFDRLRAARRDRRAQTLGAQAAASMAKRPWDDLTLPAEADVASLLHHDEKAMLYWLARDHVDGRGCVIDAGPLIGGSTAPLSAGLRDNPRRPSATRIRSYDLFRADETNAALYQELLGPVAVGDDLLPRFRENVGDELLGRVDPFQGDLMDFHHDGTPIEVLFIDVGKSWGLNDHLTREFFPSLVPGHSVVIQQDWVHEMLPWLHVTMELFADRFAWVGTVKWASAVWVCTKPIAPEEIPASLRTDVSDDRKLALMEQAVARADGEDRGVLEAARAVLLAELGDRDGAIALLDETERRWPDSYGVKFCVNNVRKVKLGLAVPDAG